MSEMRATPSPRMVIPPIITSENERQFLLKINTLIDSELGVIDQKNPEERYTVYQNAFDQVFRRSHLNSSKNNKRYYLYCS